MQSVIDYLFSQYYDMPAWSIALEVIATIFGIASVLFAQRAKIWVYPTGIISTLIYIYVTFVIGYYGDFVINIYYTGMSIYGWILWSGAGDTEGLKVSYCNKKDWLTTFIIFASTMVFIYGIYTYFDKFNDWTNYVDVLTTGLAFGSMWLMAKKKVENWIGWIITDLISVPLYFEKGLTFTGFQFFVFLILAVQGYFLWRNLIKNETTKAV